MTVALNKARSQFTAQGNTTALSVYVEGGVGDPREGASYTGDTPVTIDNTYNATLTGGQNSEGADYLVLDLDVTTPQTTAGTAQIWERGSDDGISYTRWRYSHTVGETLKTTADLYDAGLFALVRNYTQLCVVAIDYGMKAELLATPKLQEFI